MKYIINFDHMELNPELTEKRFNNLLEMTTVLTTFSIAFPILEEVRNKLKSAPTDDPFWQTVFHNVNKHLESMLDHDKSPVTSVLTPITRKFNPAVFRSELKSSPSKYLETVLYFYHFFRLTEKTFLDAVKKLLPLISKIDIKDNFLMQMFELMWKQDERQDFNRKLFLIILDAFKNMNTYLLKFILSPCGVDWTLLSTIIADEKGMQKLIEDLLFMAAHDMGKFSTIILEKIFDHIQTTGSFLNIRTKVPSIDSEKSLFEVLVTYTGKIEEEIMRPSSKKVAVEETDEVTVEETKVSATVRELTVGFV